VNTALDSPALLDGLNAMLGLHTDSQSHAVKRLVDRTKQHRISIGDASTTQQHN
jgi:hypothetical protein